MRKVIQHLYDYHFAENRKLWESYVVKLSEEQLTKHVDGHWSVKQHVVHLMSVDDTWFSGLRGDPIPAPFDPADFPSLASIRTRWDAIEANMRAYLALLKDDMLDAKPLEGEDAELLVWQVLLQVINHGTDHRAQLLRLLDDLGVETEAQDYIFYAYEHPVG